MPPWLKAWIKSLPIVGPAARFVHARLAGWAQTRPDVYYPRWIARQIATRRSHYPSPNPAMAPTFDILTVSYETDPRVLRSTAESILAQDYEAWRWILFDNGSQQPETRAVLDELARHPRVVVHRHPENLGITGGHAAALPLCRAEYVALVDHDDLLAPDALRIAAWHIVAHDRPGYLYSDEDKCDMAGRRFAPLIKPAPSPALLLDTMYPCHLSIARRDLLTSCAAFSDPAVEGTQDWDLVLRLWDAGTPFVHIPEILYTWRATPQSAAERGVSAKPYVIASQRTCLERTLARRGLTDRFEVLSNTLFPMPDGHWRLRRSPNDHGPKVDLLIQATTPCSGWIETAQRLLEDTDYPDVRVVVVGSGAVQDAAQLQALWERTQSVPPQLIFRTAPAPAAIPARAWNHWLTEPNTPEFTGWIPVGTRFRNPAWLWEAIGCLELDPRAALVAARTADSSGRIVGGAAVLGLAGSVDVAYRGHPMSDPGYAWRNYCHQNTSAVLNTPWILRRSAAIAVGGFEPLFARHLWDADLCVRLTEAGWRIVVSPFMAARQTGESRNSATEASAIAAAESLPDPAAELRDEQALFVRRHLERLAADRYYSAALSLDPAAIHRLAWPGERARALQGLCDHARAVAPGLGPACRSAVPESIRKRAA